MSAKLDLERRIADYYASEVPSRAPDRVLADALATIDETQQRRVVFRVPWRFQKMNSVAKLGLAAVAVLALVAFGLAVMGPGRGVGSSGSPSPVPSRSSSSSPSASPPALTETFTSNIHGISVKYPSGWNVERATVPWTTGLPPACAVPCADRIYEGDTNAAFIGLSSQPMNGKTGAQWADAVVKDRAWGDTCPVQTEPVSVDGATGILVIHCPDDTPSILVWTADRGYLIVTYRIDDRAWIDQILATVQLDPASAVDASPSPS